MFISDSVTGNASGSYYCNRWKAENALCHNNNLLAEAAEAFGYEEIPRKWLEEAETADIIIRCYVLDQAIEEAINQIKEEKENNH